MRRVLSGILTVVVLATACGDDGGSATPSTTTTTTTTTSTTTTTTEAPTTTKAPATTTELPPEQSDEEAIVAAVERFYEVIVEANNPPMLDNPIWNEVATASFADGLRETSEANIQAGEGLRYPDPRRSQVIAPSILSNDGAVAVLEFCLRDDTILYDLDSSAVLNDAVNFHWKQITLSREESGWLVADTNSPMQFENEEECVASYS